MSDLRELYQEVILDHSKNPRNRHALSDANHTAEGFNPLCGDRVTVYLLVEGDVIKKVSFEGSGCAISTASISMLTEYLQGKKLADVEESFKKFHDMVMGESVDQEQGPDLDKMIIFEGVKEYPMRVKCATLSWHAVKAALNGAKVVTTE